MNMQQTAVDVESLKGLEPIASLSSDRMRELASRLVVEVLMPDTEIFREGDTDRTMIYLLDGEIMLHASFNAQPSYITAGMPDSWRPISNFNPRHVTATAVGQVEIIRVDPDEFDRLLAWDQMADNGTQEMSAATTGKMTQSNALNSLPAAHIDELFRRMESVTAKAGEVIIRQGDPGDYYYLLEEGKVKVARHTAPGAPEIELAQLSAGAAFGEEALISDNPRNASITMLTDGRLMRLAKKDFAELLQEPMLDWVGLDQVFEAMADGSAQFLDVRVASEFGIGHLPGAINIPLLELRGRVGELDKEAHYICYCSTGRRSSAAAFLLTQQGYRASVLKQGLASVPASFIIR